MDSSQQIFKQLRQDRQKLICFVLQRCCDRTTLLSAHQPEIAALIRDGNWTALQQNQAQLLDSLDVDYLLNCIIQGKTVELGVNGMATAMTGTLTPIGASAPAIPSPGSSTPTSSSPSSFSAGAPALKSTPSTPSSHGKPLPPPPPLAGAAAAGQRASVSLPPPPPQHLLVQAQQQKMSSVLPNGGGKVPPLATSAAASAAQVPRAAAASSQPLPPPIPSKLSPRSTGSGLSADDMQAFVTRSTVLKQLPAGQNPLEQVQLPWAMEDDELVLASYEQLLLSSRLMLDMTRDEITVMLETLRKLHKIGDATHDELLSNLIIAERTRKVISTSTNPAIFLKPFGAAVHASHNPIGASLSGANAPGEDLAQMHSLRFRWQLATRVPAAKFVCKDQAASKKQEKYRAFRLRQAKIFYNGIVCAAREAQCSSAEFERDLRKRIEAYLSLGDPTMNDPPVLTEINEMINKKLESVKDGVGAWPLNSALYRPLLESCLFELICNENVDLEDALEDQDDESISSIFDYNTSTKFSPMMKLLARLLQPALSISDSLEEYCIAEACFELFDSCDDENDVEKLETILMHQLNLLFGNVDDAGAASSSAVALEAQTALHRRYLISSIVSSLGSKLCNCFEYYLNIPDILRNHVKVYVSAQRLFQLLLQNGEMIHNSASAYPSLPMETVTTNSVKFFVRCSSQRNYQRQKEPNTDPGDADALCTWIQDVVKEDLEYAVDVIAPALNRFLDDAEAECSMALLRPLVVDFVACVRLQEKLTVDVLEPLRLLKDLLRTVTIASTSSNNNEDADADEDDDLTESFAELKSARKPAKTASASAAAAADSTETSEYSFVELLRPLADALNPIVSTWFQEQQSKFVEYLDRALELENFKAISTQSNISSSVVDLFTFIEENIPILWDLIIPSAPTYYRAYAQLMSGLVQQFANKMCDGMFDPQLLVPGPMPMPRKQKKKKIGSGLSLVPKPHRTHSSEEELYAQREVQRMQLGHRFSYEELFIRLNNLSASRKKFNEMMSEIGKRWHGLRSAVFKNGKGLLALDIDPITEGTNTFLLHKIKDVTEFIGTRNIFVEMYGPLFEQVYSPSPVQRPFRPFLDSYLDPFRSSCSKQTLDSVCFDLVIKSTFRNLMRALELVVLDGGDKRMATPADHIVILKDINAIEEWFHAGGYGIPNLEYVQNYTARLKVVAAGPMQKESLDLIQGGATNQPLARLPEKTNWPWCQSVVYRILQHRLDDDAQKFISKHHMNF